MEDDKVIRPRLRGGVKSAYLKSIKEESRVLFIGDLHEPFCLDGYREFCIQTYKEHNCNQVIFAGDVIDNHFASYHETDADGYGGGEELDIAIARIAKWYKAFPEATVLIGNHDSIISRKFTTGNIPKAWLRSYQEVLHTPNWNFTINYEVDGVLYTHGLGGKAYNKAKKNMQSTAQGHLHTEAGIQWFVGNKAKVFGLQVGCGIDKTSYAMAYARDFPKPAIGCAVIVNGTMATNVLMDL